jgi:hypothetical protein
MSTVKSIAKKTPRYEVISVRLNEERLALLERYRDSLTSELGRPVTIAEAAFLVIEDRAVGMDRAASRHELLLDPTTSLDRIRRRWAFEHALSAAQWDVLAEYVQVGTEEERLEPPLLRPAVPSRESYLALLNAFEAVYQHRVEPASRHTWAYFGNLGGSFTSATLSDTDPDQRHQAVLTQIADRRELLQPVETWERPGNIGRCLRVAIREEGVDSTTLDHLLAPQWPTLWRLAARGHWIRHDHQPVRVPSSLNDDVRRHISLPGPMTAGDLTVSFSSSGGPEFVTSIDFGSRFSVVITAYPELVEFCAMLEYASDRAWSGKHLLTILAKQDGATTYALWLKRREVHITLPAPEWNALRDLVREAVQRPDVQRWLLELQQEYGEHG